jgi:hypothetical protein
MCGVGVSAGGSDPLARACVIHFEGLNSNAASGLYTDDDISNMAQRNERHSLAALHVWMGLGHIKHLKAVAYWVKKAHCEGCEIGALALNLDLLNQLMEEMLMEVPLKKDEKLFYLEKFEAKCYKGWSHSLVNYLDSIVRTSGVPLTYIVCVEDVTPDDRRVSTCYLVCSAHGFCIP